MEPKVRATRLEHVSRDSELRPAVRKELREIARWAQIVKASRTQIEDCEVAGRVLMHC